MTKRLIDVDLTDRANGKIPAWNATSSTHDYVAPLTNPMDDAGQMIKGGVGGAATKLDVSAAGKVPTGTGSDVAAEYPPGHEFDYAEETSNTSITATAEASADTIVSGNPVTYDGATPVVIEFFTPAARGATVASQNIKFVLYDGASSIGILGTSVMSGAAGTAKPVMLRRRLTPSAAEHTYHIKAFLSAAGTGNVDGGAGGSGANVPAYIRITKA